TDTPVWPESRGFLALAQAAAPTHLGRLGRSGTDSGTDAKSKSPVFMALGRWAGCTPPSHPLTPLWGTKRLTDQGTTPCVCRTSGVRRPGFSRHAADETG